MPYGDVYSLRHAATVATAITVLQFLAGATTPFIILSGSASQRGSTTSAQEEINFVRKSAVATVTAAVIGTHLFKLRPGDPNPDLQLGVSATGVIATAEGTDTDIALKQSFNVLNGWKYLPVPEERIVVRSAGIIGLKFTTAPASQSWNFDVSVMELG